MSDKDNDNSRKTEEIKPRQENFSQDDSETWKNVSKVKDIIERARKEKEEGK